MSKNEPKKIAIDEKIISINVIVFFRIIAKLLTGKPSQLPSQKNFFTCFRNLISFE